MEVGADKLPFIVACVAAAIAAFTDIYRFKVYNVLTFPVLFLGVAYHAWTGGWHGAMISLLGVAVAFAIMLVPYLLGALGAGDVKFFMSLGAWLGMGLLIPVFVIGAVATAVYATVQSAGSWSLHDLWWSIQVSYLRIKSMGRLLAANDCREDFHDWVDHKDRYKRLIPFSAMLSLGLVITLLLLYKAGLK